MKITQLILAINLFAFVFTSYVHANRQKKSDNLSLSDQIQILSLQEYQHPENIVFYFDEIFNSQKFNDKEKLEGWKPYVSDIVKKYQKSQDRDDEKIIIDIAVLNDRIIGYIVAFLNKKDYSAYIPVFAVHKDFHGKREGSLLMKKLFQEVCQYPNSVVSLHCLANDKKVVNFYRSRPEFVSEESSEPYSSGNPKLKIIFKTSPCYGKKSLQNCH